MRASTFLWAGAALIGSFVIGRATATWPRFDPAVWGTLSDWVLILVTASVAVLAATLPHRLAHQRKLEEYAGFAQAAYGSLTEIRESLMNCIDHYPDKTSTSTSAIAEMVENKWYTENLKAYCDNIEAVSKGDHFEFNAVLQRFIDDCSRLDSCYSVVVDAARKQSELETDTVYKFWGLVSGIADYTDYMRHIVFRRFGAAHLRVERREENIKAWWLRTIIWRLRG